MSVPSRDPVEVLLTRTATQWRSVADDISRLATTLRAAVGPKSYRQLVTGLDDAVKELLGAVTRFEASAKRPEVVIATTGTTSSGKSTLANLLIGESLLPKAVQEMSAGVVAVQHDDHARRLTVEETRGASWPTGTWDAVSAGDVQTRLESTMQAYRDLLGENGVGGRTQVEPPRFRIIWPTRIGRRPTDFGLPSGAQLTIVDLPGLKYVDDDLNGGVVREQARRALCIVAYNSFETDPRKQESLLRQVVDQVKTLSGSPARMLFTLNRIDAFRNDRDPAASEHAFTDRVTRQIRSGIREALSEYAAEASTIEPIPLSSEPALYAVLAEQVGTQEGNGLLRRLAKEYAVLYPDEEMDRLPRSPADWTVDQRRWFLNEARHQSRLDSFEKRLATHINRHLPELLLPELVDDAYRPARKVLAGLDALVGAYSLHERAQADAAKDRLESLHKRLKELQREALKPLIPLREVASGDGDLVENLLVAVPKVEADLGLVGARGAPGKLSALQSALPDAVQVPLQRLNDYVFRLMEGEQLEDAFIQSAGSAVKLHAALEELRASPYSRAWKKGGSFEGADAEHVSCAIRGFAHELSAMASKLVTRESSVQAARMKAALGVCGEAIINKLESDALAEFKRLDFQGLRGVFRGDFDLAPPLLPRVRFAPDVKHWTRIENNIEQQEYWIEKRVWWKLWLGKKQVKKTRTVVVATTKEGITVGKLGDLLEGFAASGGLKELEEFFATWLGEGISEFDRTLERRLREGVKTYRPSRSKSASPISSVVLRRASMASPNNIAGTSASRYDLSMQRDIGGVSMGPDYRIRAVLTKAHYEFFGESHRALLSAVRHKSPNASGAELATEVLRLIDPSTAQRPEYQGAQFFDHWIKQRGGESPRDNFLKRHATGNMEIEDIRWVGLAVLIATVGGALVQLLRKRNDDAPAPSALRPHYTSIPKLQTVRFAVAAFSGKVRDAGATDAGAGDLLTHAAFWWVGSPQDWDGIIRAAGLAPISEIPDTDDALMVLLFDAVNTTAETPSSRPEGATYLREAARSRNLRMRGMFATSDSCRLIDFGFRR